MEKNKKTKVVYVEKQEAVDVQAMQKYVDDVVHEVKSAGVTGIVVN